MDRSQIGKQPPRYTFFLNPYLDSRFTKCPGCDGKMGQKKLPLVIHVDDWGPVSINKTCRYCSHCDLLIVHQDEIESLLAQLFERLNRKVVGNNYLIIGTLDRPDWKRGASVRITLQEMIEALHDFKEVVQFKLVGGWGREENR